MLTVENLSTSYGSVKVLHGVNLSAEPGKITCIMGRNGVGKTTLMKSIIGSLKTTAGRVMMGGQDVTPFPSNRRARSGIALVAQGRHIFPKLTVMENLRVGLEARTDRVKVIPEMVFDFFPVLKTMSHRMGGDLSGGQQQQLAIARALVGNPKVLLLDEPTEGIQPNIIQLIGTVLRKLVDEMKMAVVLVEQYLDFVKEFGHSFHIMNRGQVIFSGVPSDLTEHVVAQHLSV